MKPDSERVVHEGKLVDFALERWGEADREVVRHPGAVAIVAVDRDGCVMLGRQLREAVRKPLLELPAGIIEEGESPLECARRELEEETGLYGGRWRELGAVFSSPGYSNERIHLFAADGLETGDSSRDGGEEIELVRRPIATITELLRELEDAKTVAGLLLYLQRRGELSTS